jgi:hypothetical protein
MAAQDGNRLPGYQRSTPAEPAQNELIAGNVPPVYGFRALAASLIFSPACLTLPFV